MMIEVLKSKLHCVRVTEANLNYMGSITIDEDLLDAAKITSGNETIHPQQLHFGEMILQANGEFAEMMDEKNLDIISKVPSETMDAWIDGAKTWRILSNLYANACKYALPQTRVYVDVSENENEVCFCMKNISKERTYRRMHDGKLFDRCPLL